MKYAKKQNGGSKTLKTIVVVLAAILVVLLVALAVIVLGNGKKGADNPEGTQPSASAPPQETTNGQQPTESTAPVFVSEIGKEPAEYTWEEYEALDYDQQAAFQKSFGDTVAFDNWLTQAQENAVLPWENGGKQPAEYTWEEYEALSDFLKEAFFESFADPAEYDRWMRKAQGEEPPSWEDGGKQPAEYTWEEYEAMSLEQQAEFQKSFESIQAFDEWVMQAQANVVRPWENGGKQPADYTWEEYEALSDFLKEAFFESFETPQAYEQWIQKNNPEVYPQ